jgi:hypothetical protein
VGIKLEKLVAETRRREEAMRAQVSEASSQRSAAGSTLTQQ